MYGHSLSACLDYQQQNQKLLDGSQLPADDLLALHRGCLYELTRQPSLISVAVSTYLHSLLDAGVSRAAKILPALADVQAWPESGLGRIMVSLLTMGVPDNRQWEFCATFF